MFTGHETTASQGHGAGGHGDGGTSPRHSKSQEGDEQHSDQPDDAGWKAGRDTAADREANPRSQRGEAPTECKERMISQDMFFYLLS